MSLASSHLQHTAAIREAQKLNEDGQDCYSATSSRFSHSPMDQSYLRPTLDESQTSAGLARPAWPGNASFAVCLTHDVDQVAWHQPRMHWKRLQNHFIPGLFGSDPRAARGLRSAMVEFPRSLLRVSRVDPLCCYERWLQAEREVDARSTFLFLPDRTHKPHYSDGTYRYNDQIIFDGEICTVSEMMRELHTRGWEVGLHASWRAFDSLSEMQRQKEQVERAIDADVVSVRHHYLHFDVRRTPQIHHQVGLLADSSLGFNDDVGFRYGTSYPWRLRDLDTTEELNVLELPLIIQEKCLIRLLAHDCPVSALKTAMTVVDRVQEVGGVLTLLWHPCSIRHPMYFDSYRKLLFLLKQRNAWFGTMADVAQWWMRG